MNDRFARKAVVRESQFLTGLTANLAFLNSGPAHGRFRCTLYAYKLGTRVSTSEKCPKLVLVSTGRCDTWIRDFVEVLELRKPDFENADRDHAAQADVSVQANESQTAQTQNTLGFRANEFVAYPAHGVGQIIAIEVQTVAGDSLEFFVIHFAKSKMMVRVPTRKAASGGMRRLTLNVLLSFARHHSLHLNRRLRVASGRFAKDLGAELAKTAGRTT